MQIFKFWEIKWGNVKIHHGDPQKASFDVQIVKIGPLWPPVGELKKRKGKKVKSDISRMRRDVPCSITPMFGG